MRIIKTVTLNPVIGKSKLQLSPCHKLISCQQISSVVFNKKLHPVIKLAFISDDSSFEIENYEFDYVQDGSKIRYSQEFVCIAGNDSYIFKERF